MMLNYSYPVDRSTFTGYFICFLLQGICGGFSFVIVILSIILFMSLCIYAEAFFNDWKKFLYTMTPNERNNRNEKFSTLVSYHSDILE